MKKSGSFWRREGLFELEAQMARSTKKSTRQILAVQKKIEKTSSQLKVLQDRLQSLQSTPSADVEENSKAPEAQAK